MKSLFFTTALVLLFVLPNTAQIRVTSSNNIGIGTNDPGSGIKFGVYGGFSKFYWGAQYPLQFNVTAMDPRIQSNNKVVFYNLTNTGFIDVQMRTLYEFSDRAAKENIKPLSAEAESPLSKIEKLKGVSYQWKNEADDGGMQAGFIAQEVEQVLPEVVAGIDSTGAKMVSYTHIVPYLVEAVKEQQVIIDKLQMQLNQLSNSAVRKEEPAVLKVNQENPEK